MNLNEKAGIISSYIRECEQLIHNKGHEIAQSYNLTLDQYHLLIYLYKSEIPPTIGEIAGKFGKAQNTISEKISRLEEKGFVERITDQADRRVNRVLITEEGKSIVEIVRKERSDKFIFNAIKGMDTEQLDNLLEGLKQLLKSLKKGV